MWCLYGSVLMDVVSVEGVEAENIYSDDETTHLATRTTISLTCVLNPDVRGFAAGKSPAAAYRDAIEALRKPRQKLVLFASSKRPDNAALPGGPPGVAAALGQSPLWMNHLPGGGDEAAAAIETDPFTEVVIESPRRGETTDSRDGPTPLRWELTNVNGAASYLVRFVVRTDLPPKCSTSSPIASHRWTMSFGATEAYFTVRRIDGVAHLRKNRLEAMHLTPDDLRAYLAHPVPVGYKRQPPEVSLSPDGTVLTYSLVDVEQPLNVHPHDSGIVHLDVVEDVRYERGSGPGELGIHPVGGGGVGPLLNGPAGAALLDPLGWLLYRGTR